jgi:uncharacterized RDD family membrane protein YckC
MAAEIASAADRVKAGFIDGLLFLPLFVLDQVVTDAGWGRWPTVAYFLLSWQVGWVYSVVLHGWRGRTVGKAVVGLRVVRHRDRGRLGWGRSVVRDLPIIALCAIGSAVWVGWHLADAAGVRTDALDLWADRVLGALVYFNWGWLVLEFATMLLHPERRAIHDLLAGSVVVRDPLPDPIAGPGWPGER